MKKPKLLYSTKVILRKVKESSKPVFHTLQRFYFGLLPKGRAYAGHSWRFVILASHKEPCDDIDYTGWLRIAQALQLPTQVIQSNLKRKGELVGYLEIWEKGILKCQRELRLKKEGGITIRFSSRSLCLQPALIQKVDLGSIVLP